ncbi:MAG: GIY-YIG nuclease family protein [Nostoc indistinguendum CM1-VF10]|jgi:hypothetical protein|nr:GIY-YIG nuclease family protein [Nostoc indistinguendum CM1-VF10]
MINPQELDLQSLPWLPLEEKAAFPKRAAIYFAIDSQKNIQYIGRSVNVRERWDNHHKYHDLAAMTGIRIAYLLVDLPELLPAIEDVLILHFQPPLNIIGVAARQRHALNQERRMKYMLLKDNSKYTGIDDPALDLIPGRKEHAEMIREMNEIQTDLNRLSENMENHTYTDLVAEFNRVAERKRLADIKLERIESYRDSFRQWGRQRP